MRDNVLLSNATDTVIVNQRSYCELIKWLIVAYVGVSYEEASPCVEAHTPFFERLDTLEAAYLESHDWPYYYTAMDFYFNGHSNATPVLPSPDTPEGLSLYKKVERDILHSHMLKEPIVWEDI